MHGKATLVRVSVTISVCFLMRFLLIVIIFLVFLPVIKLVNNIGVGFLFNPCLEIAHDILIVQAAQVGDLSSNALELLRMQLLRKHNLFDGVDVAI